MPGPPGFEWVLIRVHPMPETAGVVKRTGRDSGGSRDISLVAEDEGIK